jgi:hypothetical protein
MVRDVVELLLIERVMPNEVRLAEIFEDGDVSLTREMSSKEAWRARRKWSQREERIRKRNRLWKKG